MAERTWAENLKELDRLTCYRDDLLKMLVDAENQLRAYKAAYAENQLRAYKAALKAAQ